MPHHFKIPVTLEAHKKTASKNGKGLLNRLRRRASWLIPSLRFLSGAAKQSNRRIFAIWDLQAVPYSIGNLLSLNEVTLCLRFVHRAEKIDIGFVCDPQDPARSDHAGIIDSNNYYHYLTPLVSCCLHVNPHLGSFFLFDSYEDLERFVEQNIDRYTIWPSADGYLEKKFTYAGNFDEVQNFYGKYGFIPHLSCRPFTLNWAYAFFKENVLPDVAVVVHLRNNPEQDTQRNSKIEAWLEFFGFCNEKFGVKFVIIGTKKEIDPRLRSCPNVIIAKDFNTTVEQDMALIQTSAIYMGVASGPGEMAVFSDKPYLIMNFQLGSETITKDGSAVFANRLQKFVWEPETAQTLIREFSGLFYSIDIDHWKSTCRNARHINSTLCLQ